MKHVLELKDIRAAHERIGPYIHRTPVITGRHVDEAAAASVFCKCENLQRVGAFKIRGATNAVLSLSDAQLAAGVATHSSGNHGAALSRAAAVRGATAHIVMPENASRAKIDAVESYGGRIVYCSSDPADRQAVLERVLEETGAHLVHPFDDYRIIAGQATVGVELLDQVPNLDAVLVPVGGGGLISGIALAVRHINPATRVIGVEPKNVDDAFRSFRSGTITPVPGGTSVADGLLTTVGEKTFDIISRCVDDIVTVDEAAIVQAMRFAWTRLKVVVEPSASVPLAALLSRSVSLPGARVGVVFSGGNVDLDRLPWV